MIFPIKNSTYPTLPLQCGMLHRGGNRPEPAYPPPMFHIGCRRFDVLNIAPASYQFMEQVEGGPVGQLSAQHCHSPPYSKAYGGETVHFFMWTSQFFTLYGLAESAYPHNLSDSPSNESNLKWLSCDQIIKMLVLAIHLDGVDLI